DAIDEGTGKERIVGRTHPVEQLDARVLPLDQLDLWAAQRLGAKLGVGVGVQEPLGDGAKVHFLGDQIDLLVVLGGAGAFALGVLLVDRLLGFGILGIDADGREDVGVGTVFRLRPAIKRMLVALSAFDAHA